MIQITKSAGRPYLFLNGELDLLVERALDHETSYRVMNADYAIEAYYLKCQRDNAERRAAGKPEKEIRPWDGMVHLMGTARTGARYLPVGFLPTVKKVFAEMDVPYETSLRYEESGTLLDLKWKGPELRMYQREAVMRAVKSGMGMIQLPTGSGKTLIGIYLVYAHARPTLILVHRQELFDQWVQRIEEYMGFTPAHFNDESKDFGEITVAMVPSLIRQIQNKCMPWLPTFDVLIQDEVHHVPADTFYEVAMKCDAKYRFGLTATARREDGADLKMVAGLGPIIVSVGADTLVDQGYLARPRFEFIRVPPAPFLGRRYAEVYKNGIVLNEARNEAIAQRARQLMAEGRQVYIHVEQINHGKILSGRIPCPFVWSKSPEREEIIQKFRDGLLKCLVSTLLGEGVDIPQISAIIMAGGKKTEVGTIQKVGRALRPGGDFKDAIVVDFADKGKYLADHATQRYNAYCKTFGEYVINSGEK